MTISINIHIFLSFLGFVVFISCSNLRIFGCLYGMNVYILTYILENVYIQGENGTRSLYHLCSMYIIFLVTVCFSIFLLQPVNDGFLFGRTKSVHSSKTVLWPSTDFAQILF